MNKERKMLPLIAKKLKERAIEWAAIAVDKKPGSLIPVGKIARRHWFGKKYLEFTLHIWPGDDYYGLLYDCPELYNELANELCKQGLTNVDVSFYKNNPHFNIHAELDLE